MAKTKSKEKKVKGKASQKQKQKEVKQEKHTKLNAKQVEELIVKLYKEGHKPDKIGLILRDTYGIPDVRAITGKKLVKILREKGFDVFPSDLESLIEKVKNLKKHFEKNKKDYTAKRALQILEARIRILSNYYKKRGILPKDFSVKF